LGQAHDLHDSSEGWFVLRSPKIGKEASGKHTKKNDGADLPLGK